MVVAIGIALLVLARSCSTCSPVADDPIASNWGSIDDALKITLYISSIAFIALNCSWPWRSGDTGTGRAVRAHYERENTALEKRLTLWTALRHRRNARARLLAWSKFVTVPANAAVVEAVGSNGNGPSVSRQRRGARLNRDRLCHPDNVFGINPAIPTAANDILVDTNELHLPLGHPVKMVLRSKDVLHDFYVPQSAPRWTLYRAPSLISG